MSVENELAHYGVLGMKWGRRKAENLKSNPNYSVQQRKRDQQVYGTRGMRRINKAMNNGDAISVARGAEKTRKDAVVGKNKYVRQVGKLGGGAAGAGIGLLGVKGLAKAASSLKGQQIANKILGPMGGSTVSSLLKSPQAQLAVTAAAANVGLLLSGDIAVNANMRVHGYDPYRK